MKTGTIVAAIVIVIVVVAGLAFYFLVVKGVEVPAWAKAGNYLKFNWECTENREGVIYTGSGTMTVTVKEVHENYAAVEITSEITWSPSAPAWYQPTLSTNYVYSEGGAGTFVSPDNLRDLKVGAVPSGWENAYKGIESIATAYGTIKCFHFYENQVTVGASSIVDRYYDYDTGFVVKGEVELQVISPFPYSSKISGELVDTNIAVAKE